jgi:hypothetical protein
MPLEEIKGLAVNSEIDLVEPQFSLIAYIEQIMKIETIVKELEEAEGKQPDKIQMLKKFIESKKKFAELVEKEYQTEDRIKKTNLVFERVGALNLVP